MREPTTKAGQALLIRMDTHERRRGGAPQGWIDGIVAVEREASRSGYQQRADFYPADGEGVNKIDLERLARLIHETYCGRHHIRGWKVAHLHEAKKLAAAASAADEEER